MRDLWGTSAQRQRIPRSEFLTHLKAGRMESVLFGSPFIEGKLKVPTPDGHTRFVSTRVAPDLSRELTQYEVRFAVCRREHVAARSVVVGGRCKEPQIRTPKADGQEHPLLAVIDSSPLRPGADSRATASARIRPNAGHRGNRAPRAAARTPRLNPSSNADAARACCQYSGTSSGVSGTNSTSEPSSKWEAISAWGCRPQPSPAKAGGVCAAQDAGESAGTYATLFLVAFVPAVLGVGDADFTDRPGDVHERESLRQNWQHLAPGFKRFLWPSGVFALAYFSLGFIFSRRTTRGSA